MSNRRSTMPKSTNSTPSGFNEVPIHLQALNFLQHIEKFTLSKRARNTHAASKSRYKFRKLCQNVNAWKANPDKHLKDMKTAWSEWNIAGIRELREKPGTFLFMRAILTLTDDEESESEASHKTEPPVTDITRIIPNTEETESEKANVSANTAATELAKPNGTQD